LPSWVSNFKVEILMSVKPIKERFSLIAVGSFHMESIGGGVKDGKTSTIEGIQPGLVQQVKPVIPPLLRTRWVSFYVSVVLETKCSKAVMADLSTPTWDQT